MKFLFYTEFGEILDLAIYLDKVCGHEVLVYIESKSYKGIGRGIVEHIEEWHRYLGQDYIWVFDSCSYGDLQDWLRENGEAVFGGCKLGDELENNRQTNQKWFKELGFTQAESHNFQSIADAIAFVSDNADRRWILKQNGDAPKSINHLGKFEDGVDMLFHLKELQKGWNEQQFGKFDCDLMEVVEGTEVAASAFFNGREFLKNSDGKVVGYLNFEEKKEADGGTGETCGEMGTTFVGVTEDHQLFADIICRPGVEDFLAKIGFRGVFDINCIVDERTGEICALEPTMRFGIPATSYECIEGLESDPGELIEACAKGLDTFIEIRQGIGMVMCVVAKPFPLEVDVEEEGTSLGERLWILGKGGQPISDFTKDQRRHIHLYNFERVEDEETNETAYKVVTKGGYLFTVTGTGTTIKNARKRLIEYIKDNVYLSGAKWRSDIGQRVEEFVENLV